MHTADEICDRTKITKQDVDSAQKYLQDRAEEIVSIPYHMRCVTAAIYSLAIINEQSRSAISIYKKYTELVSSDKLLSYKRYLIY